MEPGAPSGRPSRVRLLALPVAALCLPLALAGCSSGDGVATDPAPTTRTSTPTASPTVGSYPEFAPPDYTYQLTVKCLCASAGSPVQVTVADGRVVDAGGQTGQPFAVTINDIITAANDSSADRVAVDWPAGQDYPNSVFVDRSKNVADDEVGYTIEDVQVSP